MRRAVLCPNIITTSCLIVSPKVRRSGRKPLTKGEFVTLPSAKVRALSVEHYMALGTVRAGHGREEQISALLRVVCLTSYMRNETGAGADLSMYLQAKAALDACVACAEQGAAGLLLNCEPCMIEQILVVHDDQLAVVPMHRYCAAWENLQQLMTGRLASPIERLSVVS
ncbi:hypothetical protein WK23_27490 [Burkholderia vietnamiensis]|nr:hypothetical protein WK23_27490 [Burkholderia vietnamiensis]KVE17221.1 hypothetical protein WI92_05305 [Burkholderia vietnamiensis]